MKDIEFKGERKERSEEELEEMWEKVEGELKLVELIFFPDIEKGITRENRNWMRELKGKYEDVVNVDERLIKKFPKRSQQQTKKKKKEKKEVESTKEEKKGRDKKKKKKKKAEKMEEEEDEDEKSSIQKMMEEEKVEEEEEKDDDDEREEDEDWDWGKKIVREIRVPDVIIDKIKIERNLEKLKKEQKRAERQKKKVEGGDENGMRLFVDKAEEFASRRNEDVIVKPEFDYPLSSTIGMTNTLLSDSKTKSTASSSRSDILKSITSISKEYGRRNSSNSSSSKEEEDENGIWISGLCVFQAIFHVCFFVGNRSTSICLSPPTSLIPLDD